MKMLIIISLILSSITASANPKLVNCARVLEMKKIPACTELINPDLAGIDANVKKGQRWSDELHISDAQDTYVLKGREEICIENFSAKARKDGVCGG